METKRTLEILVVDDLEENRKAAQIYFAEVSDVHVDFAVTLEEGMQKLKQDRYDVGIFDLYLPKTEGIAPKPLGFDLAEEAERLLVPWAVITAGTDHHNCKAAFVHYFWDGEGVLHELTELPKTEPRAWEITYERLINPFSERSPIYLAMKKICPEVPS
ncbi:response regulator, partial [Candidatus Woesearchaeota archaeon]|nr:response regulator [Candidatus Woesearchaeota archaeon]